MSKTKTTSNVDIEALVAKTTGLPTSTAVASALASLQKAQAAEEEARIIRDISRVQQQVKTKVETLQSIRRQEKEAKKELQIVADAEQQFLKTGDYEAFSTTLAKNNIYSW